MSSRRRQQVGDLIRDEVSDILTYEMKDPRLGMVTVTRVDMSPDLRYATIYASVYGDETEQHETLQALSGASGYVRRLLAPRLRIRHIPVLNFRLDHSMEHAEQIARTLSQIEAESNERHEDDNDDQSRSREDS
jgi:ribosome-binding factor A